MKLTCFNCQKDITNGISSVVFIDNGGRVVTCQECTPDDQKIPDVINCYYCGKNGIINEFPNDNSMGLYYHQQSEHANELEEPEVEND